MGQGRLGSCVPIALMLALLVLGVETGSATRNVSGESTPELVPFVGAFKVVATWGEPSGDYHDYPALDIKMKTATPVYAAGKGEIVSPTKTDDTNCNPSLHGNTTQAGVNWCLNKRNYGPERGTRVTIQHPDGRRSMYLHLSELGPGVTVGKQVAAGQLIGYSGNTGISEAPHLHYEERANGRSVDPAQWTGCTGGKRQLLDGLQALVGKTVTNTGYGCLGIGASAQVALKAGAYSGMVKQNNISSPFRINVYIPQAPTVTSMRIELPRSSCVGTMVFKSKIANGAHAFSVTWQRGRCLRGTIWLTPRSPGSLSYRWEDGHGLYSVSTLTRLDDLQVVFLGPATSRYSESYWADVTGARRLRGGEIAIGVSATGRSDLRDPRSSCLVDLSTNETIRVTSTALTESRAGRHVGDLVFPMLPAGTYGFRYSCRTDYSTVPVVRLAR